MVISGREIFKIIIIIIIAIGITAIMETAGGVRNGGDRTGEMKIVIKAIHLNLRTDKLRREYQDRIREMTDKMSKTIQLRQIMQEIERTR